MSKKIISKIIPVTPSFAAWQRAADELLTLETALARSRRAVIATECPGPAVFETSIEKVRLVADRLFRIAFAEANLARGKPPESSAPA
jgi:hypothetical protein